MYTKERSKLLQFIPHFSFQLISSVAFITITMTTFEGKTLVVTGGVSGLGYATVENFLKRKIQVTITLTIEFSTCY